MVRKKRKSSKRSKSNKTPKGAYSIICVVLALFLGITIKCVELNTKSATYKKQEMKLEQQIKEEKKTKKELQAKEEYMKTDEYIKEIAKEKLNLVEKGEKVFKPAE